MKAIFFDASGVIFTNGTAILINSLIDEGRGDKESLNFLLGGETSWQLRKGEIESEVFWSSIKNEIEKLTNLSIEELRTRWINSFTPHQGIEQLMQELTNRGYQLGIIAETTKERVDFLDKRYPITATVRWKFLSYEVGLDKRDGSLFSYAFEHAGPFVDQPIMIEDEQASALKARKIGFESILFRDTSHLRSYLYNS